MLYMLTWSSQLKLPAYGGAVQDAGIEEQFLSVINAFVGTVGTLTRRLAHPGATHMCDTSDPVT